jgi:peptidyl-prolyl cis-trans isomerase B (cyclophilin B)
MSGNKRQRELARAKYERQQARRAHRTDKRKRNQRIVAAVVVTALVLGTTAWVVLANSGGSTVADVAATPTTAASATALPSDAASAVPSGSATALPSNAADFSSASASSSRASTMDCREPGKVRANDMTFDAPGDVTAKSMTLTTNCGDIVIALDPKAPKTTSSMAFLASKGFFDNTVCHRLTTSGIFVLQCGDPASDGTGGPGYTIKDENLPAEGVNNYPAGTVAMANAGADTGGSQFFIVYGDTSLPAGYSIWGQVTKGLDLVKEIAAQGTLDGGQDGNPLQPVFIESATVQ